MATESISKNTGIPSYDEYQRAQRQAKSQLGKNDFLSLLAAQMQYQDPMSPQSDTAFVAQLAQFSSLEQMQSLNSTMSIFQYYSLTGKYVYAEGMLADGSQAVVQGIVDAIISKDGKAYAQIGDMLIDASKISEVYDKEIFTGSGDLLQNMNLIGKSVKALIVNESGEQEKVSGIVTRVASESGTIYAYLDNDKKISVSGIYDISAGSQSDVDKGLVPLPVELAPENKTPDDITGGDDIKTEPETETEPGADEINLDPDPDLESGNETGTGENG